MPQSARQIIPFPSSRPQRQQRPRPKHKKRLLPICLGLLLLAFSIWGGTQWVRQEKRLQGLTARYEELLEQQEDLQKDKELMQEQINRLQQDPLYLEQLAREMGMVKPNDTIYVIGGAEPDTAP